MTSQKTPPTPIVHQRGPSVAYPARVEDFCECGGHWPCAIAVFGPRHTADCPMCSKPETPRGRRILAQFHGWPERKEFPWNLLDDQDVRGIEGEAKAMGAAAERERLRLALAKRGLVLDQLLAPADGAGTTESPPVADPR
jgi:hypothetical protein